MYQRQHWKQELLLNRTCVLEAAQLLSDASATSVVIREAKPVTLTPPRPQA
jgi:hypothetical protein